jgi:hypothetical protein
VGGLLALTAGPAAAVLMLPTEQDWHAGGGIYWLNGEHILILLCRPLSLQRRVGSNAQLWPEQLDADYISGIRPDCIGEASRKPSSMCPSVGFLPLFQHYSMWWGYAKVSSQFDVLDYWTMRDLHNKALNFLVDTSTSELAVSKHLRWADRTRFEVDTRVPAVRVQCFPQGVQNLSTGGLILNIPNLHKWDSYWETHKGNTSGLQSSMQDAYWSDKVDVLQQIQEILYDRGIINTTASLNMNIFSDTRPLLAIPMDNSKSSDVSLDIIILFRDELLFLDSNNRTNILACAVDTRWASGKTVIERRDGGQQYPHEFEGSRVMNRVLTELDHHRTTFMGKKPFSTFSDDTFKQVKTHPSWFNVLSPPVSKSLSQATRGSVAEAEANSTTIELLLGLFQGPDIDTSESAVEELISTFVADGVSRSGLFFNQNNSRLLEAWPYGYWDVQEETLARTMVRQGTAGESFPLPRILQGGNATRMELKAIYTGYAMSASSWFDYFCIACLLTHALIAVAHTSLVLWTRETSGAWDTILELVALAQASQPPKTHLLENTSAGIAAFKTLGLLATIQAPNPGVFHTCDDDKPLGELQLQLHQDAASRSVAERPIPERLYGSTTAVA